MDELSPKAEAKDMELAPTKCAAAGRNLSVGKGFAFFDGTPPALDGPDRAVVYWS